MASATIEIVTGRVFATARIARGLSARSVAKALGISCAALLRWEQDRRAIASDRTQRWQYALDTATRQRAEQLQREGFTLAELRQTALGRALTLATSRQIGGAP